MRVIPLHKSIVLQQVIIGYWPVRKECLITRVEMHPHCAHGGTDRSRSSCYSENKICVLQKGIIIVTDKRHNRINQFPLSNQGVKTAVRFMSHRSSVQCFVCPRQPNRRWEKYIADLRYKIPPGGKQSLHRAITHTMLRSFGTP